MWRRRVMQISVVLVVFFFNVGKCFWLAHSPTDVNETSALRVLHVDDFYEEARKKKKKDNYIKALIIGAVLVKLILFPLAVKAMAVMSTISVLLSTMSLIMSSIVGYAKVAAAKLPEPSVKVVRVNDIWAKGDEVPKEYVFADSLEHGLNAPLDQNFYNIK